MTHKIRRYYGISIYDKTQVVYLGLSSSGDADAVARSPLSDDELIATYDEHELKALAKNLIDCILVD